MSYFRFHVRMQLADAVALFRYNRSIVFEIGCYYFILVIKFILNEV